MTRNTENIAINGNVSIPDDYTYFDCDVVLTNYVKKHIGERTLFAMQKKSSRWGSRTVGYWAPAMMLIKENVGNAHAVPNSEMF